jgi:uncharacterized protein YjbI with pentapeptide repeats
VASSDQRSRNTLYQGIAIVFGLAGLAILGFVLLGPLASWLAGSSLGNLSPSQRIQALDDARGRLLQLSAGIVAVGALFYNARNHAISRRTYELAERGQVTDRYAKAVEQLASEAAEVKLGAIYALERIAHDSPEDHQTIINVLCAFVRNYSPPSTEAGVDQDDSVRTAVEIQAAMQVIGRRDTNHDQVPLDLRKAKLRGLELFDADLSGCYMPGADLSHCSFHRVGLQDSRLMWIDFNNSHLVDVDMSGCLLTRSSFQEAYMERVSLAGANLSDYSNLSESTMKCVRLEGAILEDATFNRTSMEEMNLADVDLSVTDLSGADLWGVEGLSARSFRSVLVDESTQLPEDLIWDQKTRTVIDQSEEGQATS